MSVVSQRHSTFTPRALKWTMFVAAIALVVFICLLIVRPFLNVIAWSSVLVIRFIRCTHSSCGSRTRVVQRVLCSVMVVVNFVIPLLFVTASAPMRQAYEWLSDRLD